MSRLLWKPTPRQVASSNMMHFMKFISSRTGRTITSYDELYDWSVEQIADFWALLWDYAGIVHSENYERVYEGNEIWNTTWFPGVKLNFAENLLRYRDDHTAIIFQSESGVTEKISYRELYQSVAQYAAGLQKLGVTEGDRVAAYIPNIPQAIIAMLAVTSLGAIWSSCSPDFGLRGVRDRFSQITPKVLITVNGYQYNGKKISIVERVKKIAEEIPSLEHIVIVPYIHVPDSIPGEWLGEDMLLQNDAAEITCTRHPFDHPVYIMYSSGTTGMPKCMVHGAGGTLLQHYKEHALHTNLTRNDTIMYYTTCGWMMWNWLVSALQVGATVAIYDGSPAYPSLGVLWENIQKYAITVFGTSPGFLTACENEGIRPGEQYELSHVRTILSTGAPLTETNFAWVYQSVKKDIQLSSISGGTDIISCFLLGNPLLPVYSGEIQCRGLGMKVEAYIEHGQPVQNEVGELVCTAPFPSRPIYFWNDENKNKYRAAYFEHFPGVWRHGDFIRITETGGIVVYGRSDATLNPKGVRIGTAEIYTPVEAMEEIADSLVVGQRWNNDIRIVLFVVLRAGFTLTDELKEKIRRQIRTLQTPRHVPSKIIAVPDIPRTRNGKKVELAVTRAIHGEDVPNIDSLANPDVLNQYRNLPGLQ